MPIETKNQKDSDDFWHREFTLKVQNCHQMETQNLTTVDSWSKILPLPSVGSWNSTTETHLLWAGQEKLVDMYKLCNPADSLIHDFQHAKTCLVKGLGIKAKCKVSHERKLQNVILKINLIFHKEIYPDQIYNLLLHLFLMHGFQPKCLIEGWWIRAKSKVSQGVAR